MPQPPPPLTYAALCSLFTSQLTVAIHTILAARSIYPRTSFLTAKAYNLPISQSRHPAVCSWINDAVAAVENELLKSRVRRVVLVIFESTQPIPDPDPDDTSDLPAFSSSSDERQQNKQLSPPPGNRPLERYVWDVSRFPTIPKQEINTPFIRQDEPPPASANAAEPTEPEPTPAERAAKRTADLDKAHIDMQEQYRGLLSRLSTVSARLRPLPRNCTYTLCVELKDDADPPIGHPQPWIPTESGLQNQVDHGTEDDVESAIVQGDSGRRMRKGRELGGAHTVPVRTVDAGEMAFEMWIEEGAAKFG